jgi:NAD(P) transhydrogenase
MREYDLVVIGSGPGGQKAAIAAAKLGKSVAVIEHGRMLGGVCTNTGTIPSKTLREAVVYLTAPSSIWWMRSSTTRHSRRPTKSPRWT